MLLQLEGADSNTVCVDKDVARIPLNEPWVLLSLLITGLGILLTLLTAAIFYRHRRTPIVRLSSTHLSFIIFSGMMLAYSCSLIILLVIPNAFTCGYLRFVPSVSLTMIYGPMVMKTNRISRALSATKKKAPTLRMKYLSAAFLVTVSGCFIVTDVTVCGVQTAFILANSSSGLFQVNENFNFTDIKIDCAEETFAVFSTRHSVNLFLLIYCTLYAYSTRNLPDNFKETWFIVTSCCVTGAAWILFVPFFYSCLSSSEEKTKRKAILLSLVLSSSAVISLICIYFPKIHLILMRPDKNKRMFFSTARGMRVHYGKSDVSIWESAAVVSRVVPVENPEGKKTMPKKRWNWKKPGSNADLTTTQKYMN